MKNIIHEVDLVKQFKKRKRLKANTSRGTISISQNHKIFAVVEDEYPNLSFCLKFSDLKMLLDKYESEVIK